jgi:hypothetical protein
MGLKNADVVKGVDQTYHWTGDRNLELYHKEIESKIDLLDSEGFEVKASKWIVELTATDYLKLADEYLTKEYSYLSIFEPETKIKFKQKVKYNLIGRWKQELLDKDTGIRYMIINNKTEELQLLYKCYKID